MQYVCYPWVLTLGHINKLYNLYVLPLLYTNDLGEVMGDVGAAMYETRNNFPHSQLYNNKYSNKLPFTFVILCNTL